MAATQPLRLIQLGCSSIINKKSVIKMAEIITDFNQKINTFLKNSKSLNPKLENITCVNLCDDDYVLMSALSYDYITGADNNSVVEFL